MKVIFLEDFEKTNEELKELLAAAAPGKDLEPVLWEGEDFAEKEKKTLDETEILVTGNTPVTAEIMEAMPALKFISVAFTGLDHVDLKKAEEKKIKVQNCAGYATEAVAELNILFTLGLLRKLRTNFILARNSETRLFPGRELRGRKVGIVGTGAIGQRTAELLKAFGAEVLGWSRTHYDSFQGTYVDDLTTLVEEAQIIILALPLTEETEGIINKEIFAKMKPDTYLVNTARGKLVDVEAVPDVISHDTLAGIASDVFQTEPPLARTDVLVGLSTSALDKVLITPHIGFFTEEALADRLEMAMAHIGEYLKK